MSTLPRNREELLKRQEEIKEFREDITQHGDTLDDVEIKGCNFLSTAKVHVHTYT